MKRIVVIGCGAVLELCHRRALQEVARKLGFGVAGLVDPNPSRLAQARGWFPKAQGFSDARACFRALGEIPLTVITSPPPYHADHAEAAFAHGSHVLCEKPLAGSLADAERIVARAADSGKVLAVGMTRRYYPCFVEARRRILGGALGKDLTFIYREGGVYLWPVASAAPFKRQSSGGGVLLDKGAHALDSLAFLFGPGQVKSHADDALAEGVEANALTELEFERAAGSMHLSWDMNLSNGLHIRGAEGEFWLPIGPINQIFSRPTAEASWHQESVRVEWPLDLQANSRRRGCPIDYDQCFVFQLVQALRAVQLGESPAATGEEGCATLRLIASAYDQAVALTKPWQSSEERAFHAARHRRAS